MSRKTSSGELRPKGEIGRLKSLLHYMLPYRLHIAGAAVALLISSSAVLAMGAALRFLVDKGLTQGNGALLDQAFERLIGVILVLALSTFFRFYLVSTIGERVVADIRNDVYRRLIEMHIGFFETTRTGELVSRLITDTTLLQTVVGSTLSVAARNILLLIGGLCLLFYSNARLTCYLLMIVPVVVVPIILLGRRVRTSARESQSRVADISSQAEESLNAIRTVQALTLEEYEKKRFSEDVGNAMNASLQRIKMRAFLTALVITLVFGAIVTVLWIGGKGVLAGRITGGDLSAFVFYSVVVAGAVGAISEIWADLQRAAGAAERLSELLAMTPEIIGSCHPERSRGIFATQQDPLTSLRSAQDDMSIQVTFDHVSFHYPTRPDKQALYDFNLNVKAGQTVALVGPSGAGKTTLFQLLMRFYDPSSGIIRLNGIDIKQLPLGQLRGMIGIVPQDPVIFSGTARDNIRLGNITASDEEVVQAARNASALDFLEKLPDGLDSFVGEKGVQLSGGQRQRIAIARALIRNPKLLLLDEATSALDSENEHLIHQALLRLMQGRTTFVIAHRLATITRADVIVLINDGKIEAMGTHKELLISSPLYARLAELQFKTAA